MFSLREFGSFQKINFSPEVFFLINRRNLHSRRTGPRGSDQIRLRLARPIQANVFGFTPAIDSSKSQKVYKKNSLLRLARLGFYTILYYQTDKH